MSEPIKIHPFDAYRLLMEGDHKYSVMRRALEAQLLPDNQLVINGILYQQSCDVPPTEAALKAIG